MSISLYRKPFKNMLALLLCSLVIGCGTDLCSDETIESTLSPDKEVTLILRKKDCGATTSSSYFVYIMDAHAKEDSEPLFVADKVEDLKVSWANNNSVLIKYKKARIFSFTNFWSKRINNKYKHISIVEASVKYCPYQAMPSAIKAQ